MSKKNKKAKYTSKTSQKANDGFANIAKGIGGKKDVLQNTSFIRTSINLAKNYDLAEDLYLYNWLVGNIADIPANEIWAGNPARKIKTIESTF